MNEAVTALINRPRSWISYQAQVTLDNLFGTGAFPSLDVTDLAQGSFANNHFYFSARGAALNGDGTTYAASLKALTGISENNIDRSGGIYTLLQQFGYPAPRLRFSQGSGEINLSLIKDTPGLTYAVQTRTNLLDDVWHDVAVSSVETNMTWSTEISLPSQPGNNFYRMRTLPSVSTNSAWP